ncbi:tRNA(Met) cytidine acetyltransferase [Vibrio cholerae]
MNPIESFFRDLFQQAQLMRHRYGVVIEGDGQWQQTLLRAALSASGAESAVCLGHTLFNQDDLLVRHLGAKQGTQLLGQEIELLVVAVNDDFDANSVSAALGAVKGGGVVIFTLDERIHTSPSKTWLRRSMQSLYWLSSDKPLPNITLTSGQTQDPFIEQHSAIEAICRVVEGHRKRPLVLTADRGRGKSSALGIAAARLMKASRKRLLVCAPSLAATRAVFEHAASQLEGATVSKSCIDYQESQLAFIAPDELLRLRPDCDALWVDEASAIPISMLKQITERYHRVVFSTTIHGYEGCGRGFTLKFLDWLKVARPGMVQRHLQQPIRWNAGDPLEAWHFSTFALDAELEPAPVQLPEIALTHIDKAQLLAKPELLRQCFALLVNAHYQTSPNDLMLILDEPNVNVYAQFESGTCLACVLTVDEGNMPVELVHDIVLGKRRPKGQLVPSTLANQFGIEQAAQQKSVRVMRIAVHPDLQRRGVGLAVLAQLEESVECDFLSTSFGATADLVKFWRQAGFAPIKVSSQRDSASGTHSVIMIKGDTEWLAQVAQHYATQFHYSLSDSLRQLETEIVRSLAPKTNASIVPTGTAALLLCYAKGGASYDSCAPLLDRFAFTHGFQAFSDVMIRKVLQKQSWSECALALGFPGKKQVEAQIRLDIETWLSQCSG